MEHRLPGGAHALTPAEQRMATANLRALVLRHSMPTIVGMLVNSLYNVVDRIWVGQIPGVGTAALTGIGLCAPIMNVTLGLSMLVGIGAAARISIALGKKDRDAAERLLGNSLSLVLIIGVVYTILSLVFAQPLLALVGAREQTMPYALSYIRIILSGSVFSMGSFALNHPIRATGNPMRFARTQLVGGVANTILDPLFIFVFHMGIAGAAVATVLSQMLSAAMVLHHYVSAGAPLRFRLPNLRLNRPTVAAICAIGLSPFLMQLSNSLISIVANRSLAHYGDIAFGPGGGDVAIGAMTVVTSVSMLFLMPVIGINQGTQPIVGYNYGAGDYARVRTALKWAVVYALVITVTGFAVIELFAENLVTLFNGDPVLVEIGARGVRVFLSMIVFAGLQTQLTNFFQSIGRARVSIFLSLLRQVILLIPAYLILPLFFGFQGIWYAGPLSDVLAAGVTCAMTAVTLRRLKPAHSVEAPL